MRRSYYRRAALLVLVGFVVIPGYRNWRLFHPHVTKDHRRTGDVMLLVYEVRSYYNSHQELPSDLRLMADYAGLDGDRYVDPDTGRPYEYARLPTGEFRLCAVFDRATEHPSAPLGTVRYGDPFLGGAMHGGVWVHGAGRQCITASATP